ncbi:MAG TPA: hypothetical protein VK638_50345 [Edaphobacter sp.]|nr:hypothetical protein [Edaphobacter sp.]
MSKLTDALKHIQQNWKTSVSGFLTGLIGFSAVASTPNPWINSALGIKILGAASIAKVVLGMIQKDGGEQINVALPPGTELHQDTTISTPK